MPPVGFESTISAGKRAPDLLLRPRGHWDRQFIIIWAAYQKYISQIPFRVCIGSLLYECFVKGYNNNPIPLTRYFSDDKIEKNGMGETCSAYGGEERVFGGET